MTMDNITSSAQHELRSYSKINNKDIVLTEETSNDISINPEGISLQQLQALRYTTNNTLPQEISLRFENQLDNTINQNIKTIIENNDCNKLQEYLNNGFIKIDHKIFEGNTILHCVACDKNYLLMLSILLTKGANPNIYNEKGYTPLFYAIRSKSSTAVGLLLDFKADVMAVTKCKEINRQQNVLAYALNQLYLYRKKQEDMKIEKLNGIISLLKEHGAQPMIEGYKESLIKALCQQNSKKIEKYVNLGMDINQELELVEINSTGYPTLYIFTPLEFAIDHEHKLSFIEDLLKLGGLIHRISHQNELLLQKAASKKREDYMNTELIRLLIQHGAQINSQNNNGFTALHFAANATIAEYLINQGATVNAPSIDKITPLHMAASRSLLDVALYLIENGAEINALDSWGNSPLFQAIARKNILLTKLLINNGAVITDSLANFAQIQTKIERDKSNKNGKNKNLQNTLITALSKYKLRQNTNNTN